MWRERAVHLIRIAMEAVLLAMVCLSPWAYGAVHPGFEFLLDAGVGLLALLWALRILIEGQLRWANCPVMLGLTLLFLLGLWQITPLSRDLLQRVDPAAARWYELLLPAEPEQLPGADQSSSAAFSAGATVSLYPEATRTVLQRLLAVLLVFAVVRNNLASPASFHRFAIACLCNGALLSLFGLVQFFSSPHHLLYWTYPSAGHSVFGPFIYRNHFACYVNLCIGLGLGLLWNRTGHRQDDRPLRLLHDPAALWICVALALMIGSVIFTLSRGGFLALIGGFAVCALLKIKGSAHFVRLGTVLTSLVLAGGLLGWFGLAKIEERYATLWGGSALRQSRLPLWQSAAGIVRDFPVWGTGYGTCQYVDPLYRTTPDLADLTIDHLHNDHLELLVETGIVGSFLSLLIIGLMFALGYRATRSGQRASGLALGAVFAFSTLVFHCLGDFCVSVPAITLLATVLCAHLAAAGRQDHAPTPDQTGPTWHGLAPLLTAAMLIPLGWIVVSAGWSRHCVASLRYEARRLDDKSKLSLETKRDLLEAAVRINGSDAELRVELGDVYADLFREQNDKPAPKRKYLIQALQNYREARDRGPLLPGAHLGLALHADAMLQGDRPAAYRDRVRLLVPSDPTFWYYCGSQELKSGDATNAWKSWQRCLELSDLYLNPILERSAKFLAPVDLARELLPGRASLLLAAATKLYPRSEAIEQRKPILEKALRQLGDDSSRLSSADLHTKALVFRSLGHADEAEKCYRNLLEREPLQAGWRFEFAEVLYETGQLESARAELAAVLAFQPGHAGAFDLLSKVNKDLVIRK